jgi:hypothetical protein
MTFVDDFVILAMWMTPCAAMALGFVYGLDAVLERLVPLAQPLTTPTADSSEVKSVAALPPRRPA